MRDISELGARMDKFHVPEDVRDYVLREKVSPKLGRTWVHVTAVIAMIGMGFGFRNIAPFFVVLPLARNGQCGQEIHAVLMCTMMGVGFATFPLTYIAITYLSIAFPKMHSLSIFAYSFLNRYDDLSLPFLIRRLNRDRPPGEAADDYIRRAAKMWIPFAQLIFMAVMTLTLIGINWANIKC